MKLPAKMVSVLKHLAAKGSAGNSALGDVSALLPSLESKKGSTPGRKASPVRASPHGSAHSHRPALALDIRIRGFSLSLPALGLGMRAGAVQGGGGGDPGGLRRGVEEGGGGELGGDRQCGCHGAGCAGHHQYGGERGRDAGNPNPNPNPTPNPNSYLNLSANPNPNPTLTPTHT